MMVKDTDKGRELMIQINDLKNYWWLTKTELSRKKVSDSTENRYKLYRRVLPLYGEHSIMVCI